MAETFDGIFIITIAGIPRSGTRKCPPFTKSISSALPFTHAQQIQLYWTVKPGNHALNIVKTFLQSRLYPFKNYENDFG